MTATGANAITTYTGGKFWPLDPRPENVNILDIARSLSQTCRFRGHTRHFYSVAQHSVNVSQTLAGELQLWGLLHDAAEAYLTDAPRPLKRHLSGFDELENAVLRAVGERFGLPWPIPPEVFEIDNRVLVAEARYVMTEPDLDELPTVPPIGGGYFSERLPRVAEAEFLEVFHDLYQGRGTR